MGSNDVFDGMLKTQIHLLRLWGMCTPLGSLSVVSAIIHCPLLNSCIYRYLKRFCMASVLRIPPTTIVFLATVLVFVLSLVSATTLGGAMEEDVAMGCPMRR